ncbi:hypothetical protein H257_04237 [Aphanomyces astaci]|uniref:RING-type domain-containing protein n=1 Tax=Aphanomyces astaci TaxID=112090 RepID=W4GX81_APHAT|nr:hypothetical protein H257_04237 [Aphanomyces astaci]ETV83523.1 hypothetical protein H257_04237 [Aphanomyces astaci]|eukprot:XP_009826953.1 hypothetical protein H257_04237 [Aphanomyces astaci]
MLCVSSNHSILSDRATSFLERIRGTWLPLELATDFAEILALEYIKLLHRNRHVMTANERTVYDRLYTMHRMRLASTKAIPVIVGEIPNKAKLRPDVKAKCRSCNYDTSVSLMVTHDTCAICVEYGAAEARSIERKHVTPPTQSYVVECSACQCLYAVVQPHLLNIAPKCFYCRLWVKPRPVAPTVECVQCLNQYLDPAQLLQRTSISTTEGREGWWTCVAVAPRAATIATEVPFQTLVTTNIAVARVFGWTKTKRSHDFVDVVFNLPHANYFKMYTQHHSLLFGTKVGPQAHERQAMQHLPLELRVGGKRVHAVDVLCDKMVADTLEGSLTDVCNLCFEEYSLPQLETACGRCPTRVCRSCADHWNGQTKRGRVVLTTHLTCPFCRQWPTANVWQRYNKPVGQLLSKGLLPPMQPQTYYGWCGTCEKVKEMMAKSCAQDAPRVARFECGDCFALNVKFPVCPTCTVQTEKTVECDHITCICGQHWCYACGSGFISGEATIHHIIFR